jgi:hypothetical protein
MTNGGGVGHSPAAHPPGWCTAVSARWQGWHEGRRRWSASGSGTPWATRSRLLAGQWSGTSAAPVHRGPLTTHRGCLLRYRLARFDQVLPYPRCEAVPRRRSAAASHAAHRPEGTSSKQPDVEQTFSARGTAQVQSSSSTSVGRPGPAGGRGCGGGGDGGGVPGGGTWGTVTSRSCRWWTHAGSAHERHDWPHGEARGTWSGVDLLGGGHQVALGCTLAAAARRRPGSAEWG